MNNETENLFWCDTNFIKLFFKGRKIFCALLNCAWQVCEICMESKPPLETSCHMFGKLTLFWEFFLPCPKLTLFWDFFLPCPKLTLFWDFFSPCPELFPDFFYLVQIFSRFFYLVQRTKQPSFPYSRLQATLKRRLIRILNSELIEFHND